MTPGIQLSNMTRLALVVALVLAAVLAVHFLTRHPGLQSKPLKLSLCCLAVLVLGSAGLYAIAQTGPDARRLEGFDALAGADGGSAASLLESIADMDSLPGAEPDAGAVSLRLDYDGGAAWPGWSCARRSPSRTASGCATTRPARTGR